VIVAPSHPWATRQRVQWSDLATQVLITYNRASETFHQIQRELHDRGVTIKETMEVRHGTAVMEMVKVGLGVALVPRWVAREDVQEGSLIPLSLGRGGLKRQWVIAHVKGAPLPAYIRAFMQLCHKWFPHLMADSKDELVLPVSQSHRSAAVV
jgi:LysR family transcriptional regulator, low CO2-responsive transcriptional regulator